MALSCPFPGTFSLFAPRIPYPSGCHQRSIASCGSNCFLAGKAKVINRAVQDIGMGRYQWELFALCGFGWTADKYVKALRFLNQAINVQFLAFGCRYDFLGSKLCTCAVLTYLGRCSYSDATVDGIRRFGRPSSFYHLRALPGSLPGCFVLGYCIRCDRTSSCIQPDPSYHRCIRSGCRWWP